MNECKEEFFKNDIKNDNKSERNVFPWLVYFSGFTANLLLVTEGMGMTWMSPVLPKLLSNDTTINPLGSPITLPEISALATFAPIAGTLGLIPSAKLSDTLGRKRTLLIIATTLVCNYSLLAFSTHIYFYYISAFISGLCAAGSLVSVAVFNNEIAEDANRGKVVCIMGLSVPTGILLGYVLGPITSVKGFSLMCGFPALLHLIFSIFIPESPIFLALKGKKFECMQTLERLRRTNNPIQIENEYNKIEIFAHDTSKQQKRSYLDIIRNRTSRKAFFMCIGICTIQQLSGIFVILVFMASIFSKAGNISGDTFGVITGVVQLTVVLISAFVVDKLGRRPLLLTSSMTCAVALFILGLYFYLQYIKSVFIDSVTWIPILGVLIYIIGYGFGLGPIPITIVGELFPNDLRAKGCALILIVDNSAICINMLSFPLISTYLGMHFCMWFFSFSCFLGFIIMFFVLPETKGKSFIEIQEILSR